MKQPITLALFSILVVFLFRVPSVHWTNSSNDQANAQNQVASCPNPCQVTDSLALVALYNALQGPTWNNPWNLNTPVCTPWLGVELDAEGYVIELQLNANNMIGVVPPEIGDFSRLEELQIDNNTLSGSIPSEIGNLTDLRIMFLDNNQFSGNIPASFGNLVNLQILYLDNNELSGPIPTTFQNMNNLQNLEFFNNEIDSLPDLSGVNIQANKLRVYNNRLTFDDLIPNIPTRFGTHYDPQDSVFQSMTVALNTGDSYTIDLGIDAAITDNSYQWYRNGVIYGAPLSNNQLAFDPVDWNTAGTYRCQITNPAFPELTLHSRPVTLVISCGTSVEDINPSLCTGESIEINGTTYDESNPSGQETLSGQDQYGCDSLINIDLNFLNASPVDFQPTLCPDESVTVNGTVYNQANPSGMETFPNASVNGCDSTVQVQLFFFTLPEGQLSPMLCEDESIEINGTTYNQSNPSGTEILDNAASNGCDSLVNINLDFYTPATGNFDTIICPGESISYQSVIFNASNPSGTVDLGPVAMLGCDSSVAVQVSFYPEATSTLATTLCADGSLVVNGTTYDQSNPSGTEVLTGASSNGCDSTVTIMLTFENEVTEVVDPTLCPGESININGTTYNASNPSGEEMIPGGSVSGCDSTVTVALSFYPAATGTLAPTLCPGEQVIVNGNTYDASNPIGDEILLGASSNGCDSLVQIELDFFPELSSDLNLTLCQDESYTLNGTVYNASNPSGTEILANAGSNGCDSTINISLTFYQTTTNTIDQVLCSDESIIVNGNTYDQDNPDGIEVLASAANGGCDSTIIIDLSFYNAVQTTVDDLLCTDESLTINGNIYDQNNPSGTEILENASANGCDSTVIIDLSFYPVATSSLNLMLCPEESMTVNGNTYDQDNPTGTEVLENASSNGCDSTIVISLDFYPIAVSTLSATLCPGESMEVNGSIYNIGTPNGQEILSGAASNGCDSIVNVALTFLSNATFTLSSTLCNDESLTVNGTTYDISQSNGTEILSGAASNGCDSIITVDLFFYPLAQGEWNPMLCDGESVNLGGSIFDTSQPSGNVILPNAASNGCDSVVQVNLSFFPAAVNNFSPTLCDGESLSINGNIYNAGNPSGTEILENASVNGCDSTVNIQLFFDNPVVENLNDWLCPGESYLINGTLYDQNNPSGTEILANASSQGCDSTVIIALNFYPQETSTFSTTLCPGESIIINGESFDAANPTGTQVLANATSNGCDSIINVTVSFHTPAIQTLDTTICAGRSLDIWENSFSTTGTYNLVREQAAVSGCDSLLTLNLTVLELPVAEAGDDLVSCSPEVTLNATLPAGSTGRWSSNNDLQFTDDTQPNTTVSGLKEGLNTLTWTLSNDYCADFAGASVRITLPNSPMATQDEFQLPFELGAHILDILANDNAPSQDDFWWTEIIAPPTSGTLTELEDGTYRYQPGIVNDEPLTFRYQVCSELCPDQCDTALVRLNFLPPDPNTELPNGFTPNGDGVNETFAFPQLDFNPEQYPDRDFLVFNRWGDVIYQAQPYQNDWDGRDQQGQDLPEGTYYFILRLDIANGNILRGDVTILR